MRRRPLYPRRRVARRVPYRRRRKYTRAGRGSFRVKLTKVTNFGVTVGKFVAFSFSILPNDYDEFVALAPQFEAYRMTKMRCTVIPAANVGQTTFSPEGGSPPILNDSALSLYCLLPWKRTAPVNSVSFNELLSVDKAKTFRSYQVGAMNFKPATLVSVSSDSGVASLKTSWSPRIEISGTDYGKIRHYTGMCGFEAVQPGAPVAAQARYAIKQDVWITFYNQSTIPKA